MGKQFLLLPPKIQFSTHHSSRSPLTAKDNANAVSLTFKRSALSFPGLVVRAGMVMRSTTGPENVWSAASSCKESLEVPPYFHTHS